MNGLAGIHYYTPQAALRPYIDRYRSWQSRGNTEHRLPFLIPGTGVELIFHQYDPFVHSSAKQQGVKTSNCHIICLRQAPHKLEPSRKFGFISVRFRAGMFRHFCAISMARLNDSFLDIEHIWGQSGKEFAQKVLDQKTSRTRLK